MKPFRPTVPSFFDKVGHSSEFNFVTPGPQHSETLSKPAVASSYITCRALTFDCASAKGTFKLHGDLLAYYKDEFSAAPALVLPLLYSKLSSAEPFMPNPQHRFCISRNGHSFELSFLKKEDAEHWTKCLGSVCVLTDFHEKYSALRLLGMGAFGTVHLVHSRTGREHYAVKGFSKTALTSESSKAGLLNEIAVMRAFNHPRLVKLHEVYESDGSIYLVQDFVPGKTLRAALGKSGTPHHYTEKQVMEIIKALLETLAYFASKGLMHRDLKPDNILIDKSCNVRIIDYGLVAQYEDNMDYIFDRCGTPGYIAPEVFSFNKEDPETAYNDKCDVFSIGCIFFQMLFGRRLFNSNEGHEVLKQNKSYNYDDTLDILINEINSADSKINKDALELLLKMLHEDPEERISAEEALRHVYFEFLSQDITERVNPEKLLQPFSSRHKMSIESHLFSTLPTQNSANQCLLTVNSNRGGLRSTRVAQENSLHVSETSPVGSEVETALSSGVGGKKHGNSLTPFRTSNGQYAKFPVGLLHPHPSPKSSRFSILKSERKQIIEFHVERTENNESSEDDSGDDFDLQSCLEEAYKVPQFTTCSGKMKLLNMKTIGAGGKC